MRKRRCPLGWESGEGGRSGKTRPSAGLTGGPGGGVGTAARVELRRVSWWSR